MILYELMGKETNCRFNSEWFQKNKTINRTPQTNQPLQQQSCTVCVAFGLTSNQAFPGGDAAASESTAGIFTHAGLQPPELPELKRTFGTDQAKWIEMERHQTPIA
jgi:hypothetical protein